MNNVIDQISFLIDTIEIKFHNVAKKEYYKTYIYKPSEYSFSSFIEFRTNDVKKELSKNNLSIFEFIEKIPCYSTINKEELILKML
jgi:hypothetical protein